MIGAALFPALTSPLAGAFSGPLFDHLIAQAGARHRVKVAERAEEIVTAMDQANVEKSLLSAWHVPGRWMISNDH